MLFGPTRHCQGCELWTEGARLARASAAPTVSSSGKVLVMTITPRIVEEVIALLIHGHRYILTGVKRSGREPKVTQGGVVQTRRRPRWIRPVTALPPVRS